MNSNDAEKSPYQRLPDVGRLTVAILEHAVEPVLGKDAIQIVAEPHLQRELYTKLCDALTRSERRFSEEYASLEIAQGLLQLGLSDLESVRKKFWEFTGNPANPEFPRYLYRQFCQDYPRLDDTKRREAVTLYLRILRAELIGIDEKIRERVSASALLEIQNHVEHMAGALESIDRNTKTIADLLLQRNPPALVSTEIVRSEAVKDTVKPDASRIMFIFSGGNENDSRLMSAIEQYFSVKHDVIVQDILAQHEGDWTEKVEQDIEHSSLIVPLISENISANELFLYEIEKAYRLGKSSGYPRIIPVRVLYTDPLPYPLFDYISELPCIVVHTLDKNEVRNVLLKLEKGFAGLPYGVIIKQELPRDAGIPRPSPSINPFDFPVLDTPRGTMDAESDLYISRPQDAIMLRTVGRKQALINIKAPRQMGKSSMLVRGVEQARREGKKIVYLDFQQLDSEHLRDAKSFYTTFCNWVAGNLGIETDAESYWKSIGSNNIKCTKFFKEIILKNVEPLLLAIDEVDRLLASPFKSDFFGLLRSWHIDRQNETMSRLSMMLVISTEPVLLIDDIASPFNVGENLTLDDFLPPQVEMLNAKHGFPFSESQLLKLMTLVGGHPYLLRQAMYKVCMQELSAEKLLATSHADDGPYSDHLMHHLFQINKSAELKDAMSQILRQNVSPSDEITYRLKSAGLVKQIGTSVVPRYGIYSKYFSEHLKVMK